MTNFLVTVACLAHLHSCPIPNGYKATYQLPSKQECEKQAHMVVSTLASQLGLAAADFRITCEAK